MDCYLLTVVSLQKIYRRQKIVDKIQHVRLWSNGARPVPSFVPLNLFFCQEFLDRTNTPPSTPPSTPPRLAQSSCCRWNEEDGFDDEDGGHKEERPLTWFYCKEGNIKLKCCSSASLPLQGNAIWCFLAECNTEKASLMPLQCITSHAIYFLTFTLEVNLYTKNRKLSSSQ